MYAKLLDQNTWKFIYQSGLIYHLVERLSVAEAIEFGKTYGHCCVCGRLLTNYKSIELGIGPICRGEL